MNMSDKLMGMSGESKLGTNIELSDINMKNFLGDADRSLREHAARAGSGLNDMPTADDFIMQNTMLDRKNIKMHQLSNNSFGSKSGKLDDQFIKEVTAPVKAKTKEELKAADTKSQKKGDLNSARSRQSNRSKRSSRKVAASNSHSRMDHDIVHDADGSLRLDILSKDQDQVTLKNLAFDDKRLK